eukprot:443017-Rhodomonas_salina.6
MKCGALQFGLQEGLLESYRPIQICFTTQQTSAPQREFGCSVHSSPTAACPPCTHVPGGHEKCLVPGVSSRTRVPGSSSSTRALLGPSHRTHATIVRRQEFLP